LENALELWMSHTEAKIRNKEVNFARASGQLRAKSPVFCKHLPEQLFELKIKDAI
jgi:hypothetical protein